MKPDKLNAHQLSILVILKGLLQLHSLRMQSGIDEVAVHVGTQQIRANQVGHAQRGQFLRGHEFVPVEHCRKVFFIIIPPTIISVFTEKKLDFPNHLVSPSPPTPR